MKTRPGEGREAALSGQGSGLRGCRGARGLLGGRGQGKGEVAEGGAWFADGGCVGAVLAAAISGSVG